MLLSGEVKIFGSDVKEVNAVTDYVRYMDRTREYYRKRGYDSYRWAHFEDVPFTPLKKPLSESRFVLVSTTEIAVREVEREGGPEMMANVGGMYSIPSDVARERLYSTSHSFDRVATTLEDVDAFFPISALRAAAESGRIGGITKRLHGVYNAYSQRRTRERDAVEVLRRCREDGADAAILTPS